MLVIVVLRSTQQFISIGGATAGTKQLVYHPKARAPSCQHLPTLSLPPSRLVLVENTPYTASSALYVRVVLHGGGGVHMVLPAEQYITASIYLPLILGYKYLLVHYL